MFFVNLLSEVTFTPIHTCVCVHVCVRVHIHVCVRAYDELVMECRHVFAGVLH